MQQGSHPTVRAVYCMSVQSRADTVCVFSHERSIAAIGACHVGAAAATLPDVSPVACACCCWCLRECLWFFFFFVVVAFDCSTFSVASRLHLSDSATNTTPQSVFIRVLFVLFCVDECGVLKKRWM